MARFLTTIPSNLGFFNLGSVESYPTGGGGPTAYGPTSYFGSDPRAAEQGDNLNNPINLGDFSAIQKPRTVQFTQEFSRTSYEENTNRNTLLAFYEIDQNGHRQELPINNEGYVFKEGAVDYLDDENDIFIEDYPKTTLNKGQYLFVITNDIRYLETNYSIGLNVSVLDWRLVKENAEEQINFGSITNTPASEFNFGNV